MYTFQYKSELRFFCKARLEIDKSLVDESGTMVAHSFPVNHFQYELMYTFNYKSELKFFCKARLEIEKGFVDENWTMVVHWVPVNHF